ncbi:MAG TPA: response regulator [Chloroflexota bacterium]
MLHHSRVLVVDDEPLIRELVADALREVGFEIQSAANGVEAFELLRGWLPHVIVLDLMMPQLDGIGFCKRLRLTPPFARIPVLVVTAAYAPHETVERMGASAILTKPFELDHLVEMVGQLAGAPATTVA